MGESSENKYRMFKNFMQNELGITKEDIQEWVKDSCKDIARRMVANEFDKFSIRDMIRQAVLDSHFGWKTEETFKREVVRATAELLALRLSVNVLHEREEDTGGLCG